MAKSHETVPPLINQDALADDVAGTVRMATHAFDGLSSPDGVVDDLCDVVLSQTVDQPGLE